MYECFRVHADKTDTQHGEQPGKTVSGTNTTRLSFNQDDHSKKGKGQLQKPNLLPAFNFTEEKHNLEVAKSNKYRGRTSFFRLHREN